MTPRSPRVTPASESTEAPASKEALQRRMEDARESISQTVGEIRDTVEGQLSAVKSTVSGILDWREGFRTDPMLWSVGALSAGFALGYALGVSRKGGRRAGGRTSPLHTFAEGLIREFSTTGARLPLDAVDPRMKALLGFGLSELLAEIGAGGTSPVARRAKRKSPARRRAARRRR